jgi:hypothetical protein
VLVAAHQGDRPLIEPLPWGPGDRDITAVVEAGGLVVGAQPATASHVSPRLTAPSTQDRSNRPGHCSTPRPFSQAAASSSTVSTWSTWPGAAARNLTAKSSATR